MMNMWIDSVLVFLLLTNFILLGSRRPAGRIRLTALQGVLLGVLTILVHADDIRLRTLLLAAGSMAVKAGGFPWLLRRATRETDVRRGVEPFLGYTLSILTGLVLLVLSLWMSSRLPLPGARAGSLVVPVAFFSIFAGLLLVVSRKTALSQVLGYLVLENGIYTFGVALAYEQQLMVELGVLLDLLVGVFVMGIIMFHISREFDHIEVDRLSTLKDYHP
jgi:hydrogenase-4 component E